MAIEDYLLFLREEKGKDYTHEIIVEDKLPRVGDEIEVHGKECRKLYLVERVIHTVNRLHSRKSEDSRVIVQADFSPRVFALRKKYEESISKI